MGFALYFKEKKIYLILNTSDKVFMAEAQGQIGHITR
jgi:hypothetical protein